MKIEAYNIEDFKTEYYRNYNHKLQLNEIVVELKTDDNFWDVLIKEEVEKQLNQIQNFLGTHPIKDLNEVRIKRAFHPEFGNIKRDK